MKRISILILVLFISLNTQSQGIFTYEEATPVYSHIIRDSSKVIIPDHDLTSDLFPEGGMLTDGDHVYLFFLDMLTTFGGTYIEKRKMSTGELLWWNTTGYAIDGKREVPSTFHIDDNHNLVVTYYGEIQEPSTPPFLEDCQPLARIFDGNTGEILDDIRHESNTVDSDGLLDWRLTTLDLFKTRNGYSRIKFIKPQDDYNYEIKRYDEQLLLNRIDTVYLARDRVNFNSGANTVKCDDHFLTIRISSNNTLITPDVDSIFADYTAYWDVYNDDLEYDHSIDISGIFPYYWQFNTPRRLNDLIIISVEDSVDIGVIPYKAYCYFDQEGQLVKVDDFSNVPYNGLSIANIPNTHEHIYLTQRYDYDENFFWDFYHSDENGIITKLNTITPKTIDIKGIITDIAASSTRQILIRYGFYGYGITPEIPTSISNYVLTAFDFEDIGLIPVSTTELASSKGFFQISPNPAISNTIINFDELTSGTLTIRSIDGRILQNHRLYQQKDFILDVSNMSSGTYLITTENDNGQTSTQRLIVHYNR